MAKLTEGELSGKWPDVGVWPCLLSMADSDGRIDRIPRSIANMTGLPEPQLVACLRRFEAMGWLERLYDHIDWGWRITEKAAPERSRARMGYALWAEIRARIFARDDYTCRYCNARGGELECDHVVPFSRGGSDDDDNLVTACKPCNRSKRAKTPAEWLQ